MDEDDCLALLTGDSAQERYMETDIPTTDEVIVPPRLSLRPVMGVPRMLFCLATFVRRLHSGLVHRVRHLLNNIAVHCFCVHETGAVKLGHKKCRG